VPHDARTRDDRNPSIGRSAQARRKPSRTRAKELTTDD
jgi:hypothetical protein